MLFRFSEVNLLPNNEYDYDNPKFIGSIDHKDYTEYTKLLHLMKDMDYPIRGFGNVNLVKETLNADGEMITQIQDEPYSIIDVILRVPLDNINLECIEVYVSPSFFREVNYEKD